MKPAMPFKTLSLVLLIFGISVLAEAQTDRGRELYQSFSQSVYQILIIERASGRKASLGSGFQVNAEGLTATNFHVISEAVHHPERYRIEYIDYQGNQGAMQIVNFDVIHDLALIRHSDGQEDFLTLEDAELRNGEPLFSLGNPFDLGMSVVSGAYNGLIEKSFYRKILFSGSLNQGMSGGPTLNSTGHVVGVNVATSGNQISFLVPVKHLMSLIKNNTPPKNPEQYKEAITSQLLADQDYKFSVLLDMDWPRQNMGRAEVVGEISQYFNCWGDTFDNEETDYLLTQILCASQDNIFISQSLNTGAIDYQFGWYRSEELKNLQFYKLYERAFGKMQTRNSASRNDVENYHCNQEFVRNDNAVSSWKTVICARPYRDYPGLHDVVFLSAYLGEPREGLLSHFALSGVSKEKAIAFAYKFMENYRWQ